MPYFDVKFEICISTDRPENPTEKPVITAPLIPPVSAPAITPEENSKSGSRTVSSAGRMDVITSAAQRKKVMKAVTARQD